MKARKKWIVTFYVGSFLLIASAAGVAAATDGSAKKSAIIPSKAEEAAKALSLVTGTAISPMLGVGAVGAWEYFTTAKDNRDNLHWYASPLVWLPALLLVGMVAAKDVLGTALPPGLKKPIDAAEVIENKISGFVVGGAFIPFIGSIFSSNSGDQASASALGMMAQSGLVTCDVMAASVIPEGFLSLLVVPLALVAFGLVWLAGHAINILIFLSPWGGIDAALKSFRTFLMLLVVGTSFVNPYAGAVLSLIIITLSYFIAGWSFRLTVFGSVFAWDMLTGRRHRFTPGQDENWVFSAAITKVTPIRTYGKLKRNESGKLIFTYRPWLVMQSRTDELAEGSYTVGRGLFYPEIREVDVATKKPKTLFLLPPRYRTHEDRVAKIYGFSGVEDVGSLRGFKAAWNWLRGCFGFKNAPNAQAVFSS